MFPAWHIALTSLVTAAIIAAGMAGWRGRTSGGTSVWSTVTLVDVVGVGVAAGLGVLLWRLGPTCPP